MIVVSDTSPLNYLLLVGHAEVLPALFTCVVVPPAVVAEMSHPGAPPMVRSCGLSPPTWLEVIAPKEIAELPELDPGECEAINVAREIGAELLLIDERKASAVASRMGFRVAGTLAVLELAAERHLIDLPSAIAELGKTNFRCPVSMLAQMLVRDGQRKSQT